MNDIVKKLKCKGNSIVLLNAPSDIVDAFGALECTTKLPKKGLASNALIFVKDNATLQHTLTVCIQSILPDAVLWIAFIKGTAATKTNIGRDIIRDQAQAYGLATLTAISIDETWSALRLRPIESVGK